MRGFSEEFMDRLCSKVNNALRTDKALVPAAVTLTVESVTLHGDKPSVEISLTVTNAEGVGLVGLVDKVSLRVGDTATVANIDRVFTLDFSMPLE